MREIIRHSDRFIFSLERRQWFDLKYLTEEWPLTRPHRAPNLIEAQPGPNFPFIPWADPISNHPRLTAQLQLGVRRTGAGVCIIRRCSRDRMGRWGQRARRRRRGPHAGGRNGKDLVTHDLHGMALPPVCVCHRGSAFSIEHLSFTGSEQTGTLWHALLH